VKFGKIQLKCIGDDGETVKTGKTENKPVSPINRPIFQKIGVAISEQILLEIRQILLKIGK
jgi:hypothetical protein